jgi:hypothetical protein
MLCRDFMPRADDAALQERERGFDTVGRNVAVNVYAVTEADRLVSFTSDPRKSHRAFVCTEIVRHNHVNVSAHVFFDVFRQRSRLHTPHGRNAIRRRAA